MRVRAGGARRGRIGAGDRCSVQITTRVSVAVHDQVVPRLYFRRHPPAPRLPFVLLCFSLRYPFACGPRLERRATSSGHACDSRQSSQPPTQLLPAEPGPGPVGGP